MTPHNPTVFVIDTDTAFADHVCRMVEPVGVSGIAYSAPQDFLDAGELARPSCLLANTRLPGMGGLALQKKMKKLVCPIPVILTTDIVGDVTSAVSAMKNGAVDFLEKPLNQQKFLDLVQNCLAMDAREQKRQETRAAISRKFALLTNREKQVVSLCVEGENNKGIADRLDISVKTVEAHRTTTMKKMQASSLLSLANELRLIGIPKGD